MVGSYAGEYSIRVRYCNTGPSFTLDDPRVTMEFTRQIGEGLAGRLTAFDDTGSFAGEITADARLTVAQSDELALLLVDRSGLVECEMTRVQDYVGVGSDTGFSLESVITTLCARGRYRFEILLDGAR